MNLIEYFESKGNGNIPFISYDEWYQFRNQHDKQDIKNALAEYIHKHKVPFPFKQISHQEVKELFLKFKRENLSPYSIPQGMVYEKFEYKYNYESNPLGIIGKSHIYNSISNYYQQENRYNCGSVYCKSPLQVWNDKQLLSNMNWIFWRDGVLEGHDIDDKSFRSSFRLGAYVNTQFKPAAAKTLYSYHSAKNVLDMSCGWGDRLAGFYATSCTKLYVGCDPNPATYETYKKQCVDYENFLGFNAVLIENEDHFICEGSKKVIIYNLPAEDINWSQYDNTFDIFFSSPPYFCTEKYGEGKDKEENQSWSRYLTFEDWRDKFFYPVLKNIWNTITDNGFFMVNIIDPQSKKGRHKLCDDMVDFIKSFDNAFYLGQILMEMRARPHTNLLKSISGEPIWTFRKGNPNYIKVASVEDFF